MFYPYNHTYRWDELYYRFLNGKIELADRRLIKRWDDPWLDDHSANELDDERYDQIWDIPHLRIAQHRRRANAPRHPPFDAIVHDLMVNDPTIVSRLGDNLRRARANLPPGWLTAAVAVTPEADPTMQRLAQQHEVHLVTPHGLHAPYDGPIPPAFRNPYAYC